MGGLRRSHDRRQPLLLLSAPLTCSLSVYHRLVAHFHTFDPADQSSCFVQRWLGCHGNRTFALLLRFHGEPADIRSELTGGEQF